MSRVRRRQFLIATEVFIAPLSHAFAQQRLKIHCFGFVAAAAVLLSACALRYPPAEPLLAAVQSPQLNSGDTWVYEQINGYNRLPVRTVTDTLQVTAGGFLLERRSDREGDPLETETMSAPWREQSEAVGAAKRSFSAPLSRIPFPLAPGARWREQVTMTDEYGSTYRWRTIGRALGWERVRTPAGEFVALRVVREMNLGDYDYQFSDTYVIESYWYAPEVKRWVRLEHRYERRELLAGRSRRVYKDWIVWELKEYRPASPR